MGGGELGAYLREMIFCYTMLWHRRSHSLHARIASLCKLINLFEDPSFNETGVYSYRHSTNYDANIFTRPFGLVLFAYS